MIFKYIFEGRGAWEGGAEAAWIAVRRAVVGDRGPPETPVRRGVGGNDRMYGRKA